MQTQAMRLLVAFGLSFTCTSLSAANFSCSQSSVPTLRSGQYGSVSVNIRYSGYTSCILNGIYANSPWYTTNPFQSRWMNPGNTIRGVYGVTPSSSGRLYGTLRIGYRFNRSTRNNLETKYNAFYANVSGSGGGPGIGPSPWTTRDNAYRGRVRVGSSSAGYIYFNRTIPNNTYKVSVLGSSSSNSSEFWFSRAPYAYSYGSPPFTVYERIRSQVTFRPRYSGRRYATMSINLRDRARGTYTMRF